jgi:hypothetical protein
VHFVKVRHGQGRWCRGWGYYVGRRFGFVILLVHTREFGDSTNCRCVEGLRARVRYRLTRTDKGRGRFRVRAFSEIASLSHSRSIHPC